MENKNFIMECDCGCGLVEFMFDKFDEENLFIEYWRPAFYMNQLNFLDKFVLLCKDLWFILSGKKFLLYEIVLKEDDLEKFKEWVKSLDEMA